MTIRKYAKLITVETRFLSIAEKKHHKRLKLTPQAQMELIHKNLLFDFKGLISRAPNRKLTKNVVRFG